MLSLRAALSTHRPRGQGGIPGKYGICVETKEPLLTAQGEVFQVKFVPPEEVTSVRWARTGKCVQATGQTLPCPASTSEWGHLGRSSWSWSLPQNVTPFPSGVALREYLEVLIIFCASEQEGGVGWGFSSLWELQDLTSSWSGGKSPWRELDASHVALTAGFSTGGHANPNSELQKSQEQPHCAKSQENPSRMW